MFYNFVSRTSFDCDVVECDLMFLSVAPGASDQVSNAVNAMRNRDRFHEDVHSPEDAGKVLLVKAD